MKLVGDEWDVWSVWGGEDAVSGSDMKWRWGSSGAVEPLRDESPPAGDEGDSRFTCTRNGVESFGTEW